MRITNKVMFCDCCNFQIPLYEHGHRKVVGWIFPVETTEGQKMLCWKCLYAYNILDRLPKTCEINMSRERLMRVREREGGYINE